MEQGTRGPSPNPEVRYLSSLVAEQVDPSTRRMTLMRVGGGIAGAGSGGLRPHSA